MTTRIIIDLPEGTNYTVTEISQFRDRCVVCGKELPAPGGRGRPRTTCGDRCRKAKERLDRLVVEEGFEG